MKPHEVAGYWHAQPGVKRPRIAAARTWIWQYVY